jgi:ribonuclease HI
MSDLFASADPAADRPHVQVFTDGACLGNPGPGGWAYIIRNPQTGDEVEDSFGVEKTTNNRMELSAVIEAVRALPGPSTIELIGDSEYVLKGLTEWMPGWKRRGWRKSNKAPVMNADLWQELDQLLQDHQLKVQWVRGHTGHPENERCDHLASTAAEMIKEGQVR